MDDFMYKITFLWTTLCKIIQKNVELLKWKGFWQAIVLVPQHRIQLAVEQRKIIQVVMPSAIEGNKFISLF